MIDYKNKSNQEKKTIRSTGDLYGNLFSAKFGYDTIYLVFFSM